MSPARPRAPGTASLFDLVLCGTHDSAAYRITIDVATRAAIFALRSIPPVRWASYSVLNDFSATQTLSVYEQLRVGVRYLDIRVTKLADKFRDDRFWTCHGQAVCVPLAEVISQINSFHLENSSAREREHPCDPADAHTGLVDVPVVLIFRHFRLDAEEARALSEYVRSSLAGGCFVGTAADLRATPLASLPRNVVAGLEGVNPRLPPHFGHDAWLDTFVPKTKVAFLVDYLRSVPPREERDDLCVVGWTVTAHTADVVMRIASGGVLRPGIKTKALGLNAVLPAFLEAQEHVLARKANVVFCDFITEEMVKRIVDVNEVGMGIRLGAGGESSSDSSG